MKTRLLLLMMLLWLANAFSQNQNTTIQNDLDDLKTKITAIEDERILLLENSLVNLKSDLKKKTELVAKKLEESHQEAQAQIDSLQGIIAKQSAALSGTANELDSKIENTENSANQNIADVSKSVSTLSMNMFLVMMLLLVFIIIIYFLVKKHIKHNKSELEEEIKTISKEFENNIAEAKKVINRELVSLKKTMEDDLKKTKISLEENAKTAHIVLEKNLIASQNATDDKLNAISKEISIAIEESKKAIILYFDENKKDIDSEIKKQESKLIELNDLLKKTIKGLEKME